MMHRIQIHYSRTRFVARAPIGETHDREERAPVKLRLCGSRGGGGGGGGKGGGSGTGGGSRSGGGSGRGGGRAA